MAETPKPPGAPAPPTPTAPGPVVTASQAGAQNLASVSTGIGTVAAKEPEAPKPDDNPITSRRKALEAQLKAMGDERRDSLDRAAIATQLAELRDIEASKGQVKLRDLTPFGNLLNVGGAVHEQYPDDHLRWINETIPGRIALAMSKGYTRCEGQIQGGDMVLWRVPRAKWAKDVAVKEKQTEQALRKATSGNRDDNVSELQRFFDQHNVKLDANEVILKERA